MLVELRLQIIIILIVKSFMSSTCVINRWRLLLFDLFFRVSFLSDSQLVLFFAGYYREHSHLQYLFIE